MINRRYFISGIVAATVATSLPVEAATEPVDQFAHLPSGIADILRRGEDVLRSKIFEFNNDLTRQTVHAEMSVIIDEAVSCRQIYEARVVCDATNNFAEVIDSNQLVQQLYIKPVHSVDIHSFRQTLKPTGVETIGSIWNAYPHLRLRSDVSGSVN